MAQLNWWFTITSTKINNACFKYHPSLKFRSKTNGSVGNVNVTLSQHDLFTKLETLTAERCKKHREKQNDNQCQDESLLSWRSHPRTISAVYQLANRECTLIVTNWTNSPPHNDLQNDKSEVRYSPAKLYGQSPSYFIHRYNVSGNKGATLLLPLTSPTASRFSKFFHQLGLLPSAGREMSSSQSAVMLCGWGVKAGMVHSLAECG